MSTYLHIFKFFSEKQINLKLSIGHKIFISIISHKTLQKKFSWFLVAQSLFNSL